MKNRLLMQLAIGCLWVAQGYAAQLYQFVDYPELQNGYSLSGTIQVSNDAISDGTLEANEILHWEWSALGPNTLTSRLGDPLPTFYTPTRASGISIDSTGIYLLQEPGNMLQFYEQSIPGESPLSDRLLDWRATTDGDLHYSMDATVGGDIGIIAWSSLQQFPAGTQRWRIARFVPEPSAVLMSQVTLLFLFLMPSRCSRSR